MKRPKTIWLVKFRDLAKSQSKPQQLSSPPYEFKWQAAHWLKGQKPMAEIISVQPYRTMAVQK